MPTGARVTGSERLRGSWAGPRAGTAPRCSRAGNYGATAGEDTATPSGSPRAWQRPQGPRRPARRLLSRLMGTLPQNPTASRPLVPQPRGIRREWLVSRKSPEVPADCPKEVLWAGRVFCRITHPGVQPRSARQTAGHGS